MYMTVRSAAQQKDPTEVSVLPEGGQTTELAVVGQPECLEGVLHQRDMGRLGSRIAELAGLPSDCLLYAELSSPPNGLVEEAPGVGWGGN